MIENQTSNKPKPEPRLDYKETLRTLYVIGPYFYREHYAKLKRIAGNASHPIRDKTYRSIIFVTLLPWIAFIGGLVIHPLSRPIMNAQIEYWKANNIPIHMSLGYVFWKVSGFILTFIGWIAQHFWIVCLYLIGYSIYRIIRPLPWFISKTDFDYEGQQSYKYSVYRGTTTKTILALIAGIFSQQVISDTSDDKLFRLFDYLHTIYVFGMTHQRFILITVGIYLIAKVRQVYTIRSYNYNSYVDNLPDTRDIQPIPHEPVSKVRALFKEDVTGREIQDFPDNFRVNWKLYFLMYNRTLFSRTIHYIIRLIR